MRLHVDRVRMSFCGFADEKATPGGVNPFTFKGVATIALRKKGRKISEEALARQPFHNEMQKIAIFKGFVSKMSLLRALS